MFALFYFALNFSSLGVPVAAVVKERRSGGLMPSTCDLSVNHRGCLAGNRGGEVSKRVDPVAPQEPTCPPGGVKLSEGLC